MAFKGKLTSKFKIFLKTHDLTTNYRFNLSPAAPVHIGIGEHKLY